MNWPCPPSRRPNFEPLPMSSISTIGIVIRGVSIGTIPTSGETDLHDRHVKGASYCSTIVPIVCRTDQEAEKIAFARVADRLDLAAAIGKADDATRACFQASVAPREGADTKVLVWRFFDISADILRTDQSLEKSVAVEGKHASRAEPTTRLRVRKSWMGVSVNQPWGSLVPACGVVAMFTALAFCLVAVLFKLVMVAGSGRLRR
jgi:hypothetical protein